MSKLDSIILSNLRKFGSDVTIELSPGATILLAPNGTGKTTVFEAIEFGLTGKIARLGDNIAHVVRDDQAVAKVSLNFANLTASSQVTSGGEVSQEGDLTEIFPNVPETDIPFLLRLTHLLDQRENEWIVKAAERDAGSQLARLPIGRDGSRARATLPSVRRSLTEQKSRAEEVLIDHEKELNEWNSLIQERDVAAVGAIGVLRPREDIAQSISHAGTQTESLDQIPPGLLTEPVSHDSLSMAHTALIDILRTKIERTQAQINGLAEADNLIENFGAVQTQLTGLNAQLATATEALGAHSKSRADSDTLLQQHQDNIQQVQRDRISIVQELERLVNESSARQQIAHRTEGLAEAAAAVETAQEHWGVLREQHDRNLQVRNQHALIDTQLQSLIQNEHRFLEGQKSVAAWEATEIRLGELRRELDLLDEELDALSLALAEKRSAYDACMAAEATARAHFQALSSSADAIRQAVASIAEHLPHDQDSCPLCLEPHGAVELQKRVTRALEAIDPNLTVADQQLKAAVDALIASDGELVSAKQALADSQVKQALLNASRQELEEQISGFRVDPILASDTVSLAKEQLRVQLDGIGASRKNLAERRAGLAPQVAPEEFERAQAAFENAASELDRIRLLNSEAMTRLDQAVATLTDLTAGTPVARTLEELTAERNRLDLRMSDLSGAIETVQSTLDAQQSKLAEFTNTLRQIEEAIRQAQSQITQLRSNWQALTLPGDPLAEAAQARDTKLRGTLATLEANVSSLENIGVEISAWAKLNEKQLAQRLIDAQRLDRSEEAFTAHLNKNIEAARTSLSDLSKLSDAVLSLDSSLKQEIDNVQKHVSKVVPRWQALLKRVVRESRFHEASLKFFNSYNKDRAEVSVPLGSKLAPVPDVASEAQLTDLQLTFLLSMAMSHQWSPWKALLLDDPTQHHDLVHASAVFDLLRDYIVDHKFQVVIATHDALQARYFLRKLQNDGIEAKIWTLAPTETGVTAEAGHWKPRIG
ncbi:AAA family ATPase [Pseudomonas viridiflava]|uniref:AAA family ATPase n=1 Tax=Pseudomonas viridiflava TaxID=33069 RepID=UPI000F0180BF|nr:AAA family ATPase [Pseudomonas viridiflava]